MLQIIYSLIAVVAAGLWGFWHGYLFAKEDERAKNEIERIRKDLLVQ